MREQVTTNRYQIAISYARRGWAVIPVHGYIDGKCTCWKAGNCTSPGKHPIDSDWPRTRLSLPDIYTVFIEDHPYANIGIITGDASGVWGMDIDPKNGGFASFDRLIAEYGPLPETYTQHTGSGGMHILFDMPGFAVKSDTMGKIFGPGIDIRGNGNMIVMSGSESGIGPYGDRTPLPTCDTPQWIQKLLSTPAVTGEAEFVIIEGQPDWLKDLDEWDKERCDKYAMSGIHKECAEYSAARNGDGCNSLFKSACAVLELTQSTWNSISPEQGKEILNSARMRRIQTHKKGGGQTAEEFKTTWRSARKRIVGRGRLFPPDPNAALEIDDDGYSPGEVRPQGATVSEYTHVELSQEPDPSSWHIEDINDVLDGTREPIVPQLASRNDGVKLLYRGKEHAIAGEPESGKTWFALMCVLDILISGGRVTYVDFEDDATTVVGRLLNLGILKDRLRPDAGQFRYVRPEAKPRWGDLQSLLTFPDGVADLLVFDGWTEGAGLVGLDIMSQEDITKWRQFMVRPALTMGTAVLTTDHVTKDPDSRGRFSIGAQHKLAGLTGVMFVIEAAQTWGRGEKGRSKVIITKDRNGGLRPHGKHDGKANYTHIGDLVGDATSGEMCNLIMWPPFEDEPEDSEAPPRKIAHIVKQIEKLLRYRAEPMSFRGMEAAIEGRQESIRMAISWLEDQGNLKVDVGPNRVKFHSWIDLPIDDDGC